MPYLPPFQDWFIQLASILSNFLLSVAAVVGIVGLWRWRVELIGKTKFELARKMMLLAFQFRDEFHRARDPFTYQHESADRKKSANETEVESRVLDEYFARAKRLQPLQDTMRKLYESGWEAEIILGDDAATLVQPFQESFRKLYLAIEFYFQDRIERSRNSSEPISPQSRESKNTIYGLSSDPIGQAVDDAVNVLKRRLGKHVR